MKRLLMCLFVLAVVLSTGAVFAYTVPDTTDLLFQLNTDRFPDSGNTGNWTAEVPSAGVLNTIGTPTVDNVGTTPVKWEKNVANGTGYYSTWTQTTPVAVNGVTAIAVVKPVSGHSNDRNWTPVIDVLFGAFRLGVRNDNRQVILTRSDYTGAQTQVNSTTTLPDGQSTVLSAVVQPDGSYVVYANGVSIMSGGALSKTVTSLTNAGRVWLCIGTSKDDTSATINGDIGDVMMWKVALSDADRTSVETALMAKFHCGSSYPSNTITASVSGAGGSMSPTGATSVQYEADQKYSITTNYGYSVSLLADGAAATPVLDYYNAAGAAVSHYTFNDVVASHTISATFSPVATRTISGHVGAAAAGGATVSVKLGPAMPPCQQTTTDASGNYTMAVPEGVYYVCASQTGYMISADTATNATGNQSIDFTLTQKLHLNGAARQIPRMENLLFAADANDLDGIGTSGNWPFLVNYTGNSTPAMTNMYTPTVTKVRGLKYDYNLRNDGDGYVVGQYSSQIPVNGVSGVMLVKPVRSSLDDSNEVLDIFYDQIRLHVKNKTGMVSIRRNGSQWDCAAADNIPDGQFTVISFVIQPTGQTKVWTRAWNNTTKSFDAAKLIINQTGTSTVNALVPYYGGSDSFRAYINVGRNNPDGWSTFNGYIGDVFVYKTALSDTDRGVLEADIQTKMNSIATYNITATAGANGSISPAGVTAVGETDSQAYTITPNFGYDIADVQVDGASQGAISTYTFNNVTAAHTIAATFAPKPTRAVTGKVTNGTVGIAGATVYVSSTANASINPSYTVTTNASGDYSVPVFDGNWYVCASATGYTTSADIPLTVAGSPVANPDIVLVASGKNIPEMDKLIFGLYGSALNTTVNSWPFEHPMGATAPQINNAAPVVTTVDGIQWEQNRYASADAYKIGTYAGDIPVNGVTATAVVQPTYVGTTTGEARGEVIDVFYGELFLAVSHRDTSEGNVIICSRGYHAVDTGYKIPNGQKTILTLAVQPNGDMKLYSNGLQVWSASSGADYTWLKLYNNYNTITVGRNNTDGWSTFSGNIGAAFLWKTVLSQGEQINFEKELGNTFGITMPAYHTITATAATGGSITPSGTIYVLDGVDQTYTITALPGYAIQSVTVDGVNKGAISTYAFTGITADHTISVAYRLVPLHTVSGKVVSKKTGTGISGATVYFSQTPNASQSPVYTATTNGTGDYSTSIPEGTWYICAGATNYFTSADQSLTLSANATGINFALASSIRNIPRQSDLIFGAVTENLSATGATTNWNTLVPAGGQFTSMGTPAVQIIDGVKWEQNFRAENDGFGVTQYTSPLAVNGVTAVATVKPIRDAAGGGWTSVIDCMYNRIVLGLRNDNGLVMVARNGDWKTAAPETAIPDGQKTILSLVVQPDGTYKVFANAMEIMSESTAKPVTSLDPTWNGTSDTNWYWSYINVGRNNPDGWTTFNGNIGDVFLYGVALSEQDRSTLEQDLGSKFGIDIPVFAAFSGKVTLEDGVTPVAGVKVEAISGTHTFDAYSAADGTYTLGLIAGEAYYIAATKDSYIQVSSDYYDVVTGPMTYDWQMRLINTISGTVKNAAGQPIYNAIVQIGTGGPAAITDINGKYSVSGITIDSGVSFYADALGYANDNEYIDTYDAASGVMTKDVTLTAKAETGVIKNGGFETIDPATGKPAAWHEWSGVFMWGYNAPLADDYISSTSAAGEFFSGTKAAKFTAPASGAPQYCFLGQIVPVIPGSTYNVYWKMKGDAGITTGFPFAEFRDADGNDIGDALYIEYGTAIPTQWTQYPKTDAERGAACQIAIPEGAAYITVIMGWVDPFAGKSIYVDDVVIDRVGPDPTGSFTITASAGAGGSISPVGASSLSWGADQTYTIAPSAGYAIDDVQVDGKSVGAVSSYTFYTVAADHTITATFKQTVTVKPVGVNNKSVLTDGKLIGKTVRVWGAVVSKGASSYVIDDGYGAGVTINGTTTLNVGEMAVVTGVVQANKSVTP